MSPAEEPDIVIAPVAADSIRETSSAAELPEIDREPGSHVSLREHPSEADVPLIANDPGSTWNAGGLYTTVIGASSTLPTGADAATRVIAQANPKSDALICATVAPSDVMSYVCRVSVVGQLFGSAKSLLPITSAMTLRTRASLIVLELPAERSRAGVTETMVDPVGIVNP